VGMKMSRSHQLMPPAGLAREPLRNKGQFWTPAWVADAMTSFVLGGSTDHVYDPAVGAGALLLSARSFAQKAQREITLLGNEIDSKALEEAGHAGLTAADLANVELRDFLLDGPERKFSAIVANPPYVRHHRLPSRTKERLREIALRITGIRFDGRTGYHVFFLIKALDLLSDQGRLAFIMPADTCEGIFSVPLWNWIASRFRIHSVITFEHQATPFPSVDTNAMIFMISCEPPQDAFNWSICRNPGRGLTNWVQAEFPIQSSDAILSELRFTAEGIRTGLSRPPQSSETGLRLGHFIKSMRGIATGENELFFMTSQEAAERRLPLSFFARAIGRTRDVSGNSFTMADLDSLEAGGRPTYLLNLDSTPSNQLPEAVQKYLIAAEKRGINCKPLIRQRSPWYKMERRRPPEFLFAYLGRRNVRFIRNFTEAVPLTGFLCVYSRGTCTEDQLCRLLNHEETIRNLRLVAKSYGSGALKVEPRALERVPLSQTLLEELGLWHTELISQVPSGFQMPLTY
jgi:adenine-specific DNA-methyltransferase